MAVLVLFSVLFLALAGHSSAAYCVCKDGVSDAQLQKSIDYACGNGADCSAILQNGVCYNPNTVKDHCSYAVNSYYQKKASSGATCEFSGTATLTANLPCIGTGTTPTFGLGPTAGTGITPDGSAAVFPSKSAILVGLVVVFLSLVRPLRV
nr:PLASMODESMATA CALLOSE-BINDING PROTEIN 3-like [Ipomoea trifida]